MGFARGPRAGAFGDPVPDHLTQLLPHLRRALALRRELGRHAAECSSFAGLINLIDRAVILLDGAGCVRFANVAADRLLAETRTLRLSPSGRLMVAGARDHARLGAAIRHCLSILDDADLLPPPPPIIVGRGTEGRLSLHPFSVCSSIGGLPCQRLVALVVSPVDGTRPVDVRAFAEAFRLTPTEAQLAAAIGQGQSVAGFAETQGIAVSTARWHLKNIEQKAGVSRVETLILALCALQPPLIAPSHTGGAPDPGRLS